MDVVEFIKEYQRMCKKGCSKCHLKDKECFSGYISEISQSIYDIVNVVEQWSQAHPQKTMMQDFFEKFPNALKDSFGNPIVCPEALGYGDFCCDDSKNNCTVCWNRTLEE